MSNSSLINENETAKMLGCTKSALRKWRREKRGPPSIKLEGRLVRYRLADLVEYVEKLASGYPTKEKAFRSQREAFDEPETK